MKTTHLEKGAKEAVRRAKKAGANIIMMVDGFITDEEALALRDLLWHARDNGVVVTFTPPESARGSTEEGYFCGCCGEHFDGDTQFLHDFSKVCEGCFFHKEKCKNLDK